MLMKLFLLAAFLLAMPFALAQEQSEGIYYENSADFPISYSTFQFQAVQEIKDPEAVSYLHAEVSRSGSVFLYDNSPFQKASELKVTIAVPQNTSRQFSAIKAVEGPDRYYIMDDIWGNKMLTLYWDVPELKKKIDYRIVTDVEVFEREVPAKNKDFPVTGFTIANKEIAQEAYTSAYGLDDIQRFFRLTQWVHENVAYSDEAKAFSQSAEWTYTNREGACDEFSNLLVSMLHVLDYSPRYVVGYAYSESWGQHGWVEVDQMGKTMSLDPTWLESPVDSTHIKIADLPDSNFSEHIEVRGGQITIDWNKGEPQIKVISHKESPKISIEATAVPANSTGGSYSMIKATFLTPSSQCILTSVNAKSCVMENGQEFLSLSTKRQNAGFCGSQEAYWFARTPQIESNMIYTCPVIIYGAGAEKTVSINVESGKPKKVSASANSQSVLTPGQSFELQTSVINKGSSTESVSLYVFFSGLVQTKDLSLKPGDQADVTWKLKAPAAQGTYELAFFSSSGDLVASNVTVVSQRSIQISNISLPKDCTVKSDISINVTVKALTGFSGTMKLSVDGFASSKWVSLGPSESKTYLFPYAPAITGAKTVSITLISDSQQYQDGWWGILEVKDQSQWWEEIVAWFQGMIDWVAGMFTGSS